jgi:aspartate--ammonia ligase
MSVPNNYRRLLSIKETQIAINSIKAFIENTFTTKFNCMKVECPLILEANTGVNDQLDSKKKPVSFHVENEGDPVECEVIQATTKWKRWALSQYGMTKPGEGLFVDMKGIRKDYNLDMNHSAFVNQWDWEIVITEKERNLDYLKKTVKQLYRMILDASKEVNKQFPQLKKLDLPEDITFVHAEDLFEQYPDLSRNEREEKILKKHKAVFLFGIGYKLKNGEPHEERAADYDDWYTEVKQDDGTIKRGLNGDILVWNDVIDRRFEISSMGIRVTPDVLVKQLEILGQTHFLNQQFHKALMANELPLTIGGGIGQARVMQLLLQCAHIGEVSVAPWTDKERQMCKEKNISLL